MKMKSLLLASAALLALSASAQGSVKACKSQITFDMSTIKALEVGGRTAMLPVTFTRDDDATNFTNLQFTLILPEGLEGTVASAHDDTKVYNPDTEEEVQVLAWSYNFLPELKEFRTVASNSNKVAITKNPLTLCRIKLQKNAELAEGAQILVKDLKYTDYEDSKYVYTPEGGDPNEDGHTFVILNADNQPYIPGYEPHDAVENINAGKAVAGVKYYNVAGVAADEAFDGVNIVVTKYVDGTQSVAKVVK